jgi:type I restriction enzyme S subunit
MSELIINAEQTVDSESALAEGYKRTELGVIPEDWEVKQIGEISPLQRGFDLPARDRKDGKYPVVYSNGIVNTHNEFQVKGPGVVTGRSGTLGKVHYVENDHWPHNTSLWVTRFNNSIPKFIYFLFKYIGFERFASGSGVPTLNRNDAHSFKVVVPSSKQEQTAIANALSDVDALLSEIEKLISKKQVIKTATMQQLLTGQTRLPEFAVNADGSKKGYQTSELGDIPEDWMVVEINDLITDLRGGAPFKPSDFIKEGIKVLPKGGVTRGGILKISEGNQQFCSQNFVNKYSRNTIDERYTIVVLRDLVPSGPSIGLMVKIPNPEQFILAQGVYGFITNSKHTSDYIIQYSNTKAYRRAANEIMVGSTQVHITNGAFKSLKIPLPTIEKEQTAIATILSDMDTEIQALEQQLEKTQQIKQGMMQQLLTGKIRLLPVETDA